MFLMPRELFSSVQRSVLCLLCLFNNVSVEALQLNVLCLYCHWAICNYRPPVSLSLRLCSSLARSLSLLDDGNACLYTLLYVINFKSSVITF